MYDFFTNNARSFRIARHTLFWLMFFLLDFSFIFVFEYRRYLSNVPDPELFRTLQFRLLTFLVDLAFSYIVVYGFYPRFKKTGKRASFVVSVLLLLLVAFSVKCLFRVADINSWNATLAENGRIAWLVFIAFLNGGPPVKCLFFFCGKLLKDYYLKMESMKQLIRENSNAELQLLKAQVHPHFLFNTLNNIYSSILNKKNDATDLIAKLRNTLTYMLFDCQAEQVPVKKELQLITDYIQLEKIRYGSRIEVRTSISGEPDSKIIHPLLLIPIIENCFKHGSSQIIGHSWIDIAIDVNDDVLRAKIVNSTSGVESAEKGNGGIGISNVRKRMKLLFNQTGVFESHSSPETFTVDITIPVSNAYA